MIHKVQILSKSEVTHNVWAFKTERPAEYSFTSGQATELRIDRPNWDEKERPFTFTSLPKDDYLEFTIKSYRDHDGVTHKLDEVVPGECFIIGEAWGAIAYKGQGTFIAGGAGLTPFLAILRDLEAKGQLSGHRLLFGNNTAADIILKEELDGMKGLEVEYALSEENCDGMLHGQFDKAALEQFIGTVDQIFYVCGPKKMVQATVSNLNDLGVDANRIVTEE